jgi:hypothetical protein
MEILPPGATIAIKHRPRYSPGFPLRPKSSSNINNINHMNHINFSTLRTLRTPRTTVNPKLPFFGLPAT